MRKALGVLLVCCLAAGCTGAQGPSSAPGATPLGDVQADSGSKLSVSPIAFGDKTVVTASFGTPVKDRPVSLQVKADSGWKEADRGVQDAKGFVEFHPSAGTDTYRAVALDVQQNGAVLAAASTPSASAADQWKSALSDDFDGSRLKDPWEVRFPNLYYASRWCSSSQPEMVSLKKGVLSLGLDKASAARTAQARAQAAKANKTTTAKACPFGVFDNAMVSTETKATFTYGTFAVRMKFPYQRGMHASAWLQNPGGTDIEIDFIETFGYKSKGIQNILHPKSEAGERLDVGGYVPVPGSETREWWDEYHVASVEWSPEGYVFRMDGVETLRTSEAKSSSPKFLILSLLSSDYELDRLNPKQLPGSLDVDWFQVWQEK